MSRLSRADTASPVECLTTRPRSSSSTYPFPSASKTWKARSMSDILEGADPAGPTTGCTPCPPPFSTSTANIPASIFSRSSRKRLRRMSDPFITLVGADSPAIQGCRSISAAVRRASGSGFMSFVMRSSEEGDRWSHTPESSGSSGLEATCFLMSSSVVSPLRSKGCSPVSMMKRMTPRLHMSVEGEAVHPFWVKASGGQYATVPALAGGTGAVPSGLTSSCTTCSEPCGSSPDTLEHPKSTTRSTAFCESSAVSMRFSGLRSAWTTPTPCKKLSAEAACFISPAPTASLNAPERMRWSNISPPRTRSSTR
mmetsp:Transcript_35577/g.70035  ORF Transcript_35577/g.70035 Transcript_35577/m.70035 type:complete len:311 (-) Transcript_35577:434-1366(-)